MKFTISENIVLNYPELRIAVLIARGVDNKATNDLLENFKLKKLKEFLAKHNLEDIKNHPYIKLWRKVYRSFGTSPKKKTPTAEAFLTRVIKTQRLPNINPVVDLYLLAELEYMLPIGGYDLNKIDGNITLRYSEGKEKFVPLGSDKTEETYPGEIVYADKTKILTRRWNYKDSDITKITHSSTNIVLMSEAPTKEIPTRTLEALLSTLKDYIGQFCKGEFKTFIVEGASDVELL